MEIQNNNCKIWYTSLHHVFIIDNFRFKDCGLESRFIVVYLKIHTNVEVKWWSRIFERSFQNLMQARSVWKPKTFVWAWSLIKVFPCFDQHNSCWWKVFVCILICEGLMWCWTSLFIPVKTTYLLCKKNNNKKSGCISKCLLRFGSLSTLEWGYFCMFPASC